MQFSTLLLAAAAFTGLTNAVQFTNLVFNNVTAGEPFTFTWANATGDVTILLKNGPPLALQTVSTITSGESGTSYTWDVPANLASDTYAFEIRDSTARPNYSVQFQLIGGAAATTSSATVSATASSTTTATESITTTASSNLTSTTRTASRSTTGTASTTASGSGTGASTTPTSAPGMAAGFTSNLAFVFLAAGALVFLN